MKKTLLLIMIFGTFLGFSQQKSTGVISLTSNMTANLTLNNTTSKARLVLTGPFDRWFALGIGVSSGFGMQIGDVLVYTTSLSDCHYGGYGSPSADSSQDWTPISNNVNVVSGVRTLTLERNLTNGDSDDFQMAYASTNSISFAWARSDNASFSVNGHAGNRGFQSSTLTLGVDDFSLNATQIYPNPSNGTFLVKTNTNLDTINVYSQTGSLVKTIEVQDNSDATEVEINSLQTGIYLLQLINSTEKTWKKIIVQ